MLSKQNAKAVICSMLIALGQDEARAELCAAGLVETRHLFEKFNSKVCKDENPDAAKIRQVGELMVLGTIYNSLSFPIASWALRAVGIGNPWNDNCIPNLRETIGMWDGEVSVFDAEYSKRSALYTV